jgi:hypothetical protein
MRLSRLFFSHSGTQSVSGQDSILPSRCSTNLSIDRNQVYLQIVADLACKDWVSFISSLTKGVGYMAMLGHVPNFLEAAKSDCILN